MCTSVEARTNMGYSESMIRFFAWLREGRAARADADLLKPRTGIIAGLDRAIRIQCAEKQLVLARQKREQSKKTQIAGGLIWLGKTIGDHKKITHDRVCGDTTHGIFFDCRSALTLGGQLPSLPR